MQSLSNTLINSRDFRLEYSIKLAQFRYGKELTKKIVKLTNVWVKIYIYFFKFFKENLFDFDENDLELKRVLCRRNIIIEDLKDLLSGSRIVAKKDPEPEGLYDQATVLELIQPETFESPTVQGMMIVK